MDQQQREQSFLTGSPAPTQDEKTWGMLAHLSGIFASFITLPFLGPLLVMLIKGKESKWVEAQAKEALNFTITVTIVVWIGILGSCLIIPAILALVVGIAAFVLNIIGAMKANNGEMYRYPANIRLLK
ncbi:DUF4870 domain-containing protein [Hyalangium minutum]|uniref:Orotate phosphoribosyltransferase n=1 Tax=Hyalangium minutum TaxID=394096 RepID=A0A085WPD6_9BACT|nr:DUF4870 domain-containing protein [Hyalangium minutum]KFE69549.1 hypothetical protein DB31_6524 [Hyalangium minutum]